MRRPQLPPAGLPRKYAVYYIREFHVSRQVVGLLKVSLGPQRLHRPAIPF